MVLKDKYTQLKLSTHIKRRKNNIPCLPYRAKKAIFVPTSLYTIYNI